LVNSIKIQNKKGKPPKCLCGCEKEVNWDSSNSRWYKYLNLHRQRKGGWKHSDETKAKMSISNKIAQSRPDVVARKKKLWTKERRKKASKRLTKLMADPKRKLEVSKRIKRLWLIDEYKEKFSQKWTKQQKIEIAERSKAAWTEERKRLQSLTSCGLNNPNWKGGLSLLPYCYEWTKDLKSYIKERDYNTCQNPSCDTIEKLAVHHINYDKLNCDPDNLITLCMSCNSKANGNREFWKELYQGIINDKIAANTKFSKP